MATPMSARCATAEAAKSGSRGRRNLHQRNTAGAGRQSSVTRTKSTLRDMEPLDADEVCGHRRSFLSILRFVHGPLSHGRLELLVPDYIA